MAAADPNRTRMTLADEELMQLMRQGDAQAFEVIYERHAHAAFSLAYRMTGRRGAAEDVVQEAFLSLWRSGARYDRTRCSVRTWVLGIVHNRAIDVFRRGTPGQTSIGPQSPQRSPPGVGSFRVRLTADNPA